MTLTPDEKRVISIALKLLASRYDKEAVKIQKRLGNAQFANTLNSMSTELLTLSDKVAKS